MRRFLITGGAGFIGSNFIRFLLRSHPDISIVNLDKLTYAGNLENLKEIENNLHYQFVKGDICNARLMERLMQSADTVVHFASETHVDRSIDSAEDFVQTNIVGTRALLDAALKTRRMRRFIHFSTDEVYGAVREGYFTEESPFRPTSPYAASKAAADLMVQAYQKTHRIPAIILRGCNNFGPYQFPEKVIPLFITNLLEGKNIPIYARGENSREWIYVEDTCRAIYLAQERGSVGDVYNVGSDFELKNIELARRILGEMNSNDSRIAFVKDRPAHDLRYRLKSARIKQLGFQIESSFDVQLRLTIDWYQKNKNWWKPLKKDRYTLK